MPTNFRRRLPMHILLLSTAALAACGGDTSSNNSTASTSTAAMTAGAGLVSQYLPIRRPGALPGLSASTLPLTGANATTGTNPATTPTTAPAASPAVVGFSSADYAISQTSKSANVVVNRSGSSGGPVTVSYSTFDGTGVAGTLYTAISGTLQWDANDTSPRTITVPVNQSTPFSGVRSFKVGLLNPSAYATLGSASATTVSVAGDAVPATVQLTAATYSVAQNAGSITISVSRSGAATSAVSVAYATTNGTATAGTNYTAAQGTLNWAANDSAAKTFSVAINGGAPQSGNLTFGVTLSAPGGAALGGASTATVTITPVAASSGSAASILAYLTGLKHQSSHRVLSGQHADIWNTPLTSPTVAMDVVAPLASQTGQNPAILGLVLNYATDSYAYTVDVTNTLANQWWSQGGLVMLSLYDNDPTFSFNSSGAPTGQPIPSSAFHQMTVQGSTAYTQWHSQLDTYAAALHALTDSGNTVLFRPFIEINGNWNWYGAQDPADFIAVWQDMYHYLMVTKGLKNVLWIYNVNQNVGNYTSYYPGSQYVDIVGLDIYGTPSEFVNYGNAGNAYASLDALGKPMILPEVGLGDNAPSNDTVDNTTIINDIRNSFPDFVGFVVFNGGWAICNQNNASGLMNDPWVVDLSGLPSGI